MGEKGKRGEERKGMLWSLKIVKIDPEASRNSQALYRVTLLSVTLSDP